VPTASSAPVATVRAGAGRGPRTTVAPAGPTTAGPTTVADGADAGAGSIEVRDPTRRPEPASVVGRVAEVVGETATVAAKTSSVPAVFVSFVFAFLVIQDRFDRNDPKLAPAPVTPDPELVFRPRHRELSS
jgi:hypothetical protein